MVDSITFPEASEQLFPSEEDLAGVSQEQRVNIGLKEAVLTRFQPFKAPDNEHEGEVDPLAPYNKAAGASVTHQDRHSRGFTGLENLLKPKAFYSSVT